jgi:HlyD family secretion protein
MNQQTFPRKAPLVATAELGQGMDQPIARAPAWRRYGPYALLAALGAALLVWLVKESSHSTYRIATDRLSIGTVTRGRFEDFIAVRAAAAPSITHYLTADQGGAVQKVLVEDGAKVKAGQPLIVLANSALQLQIASREADAAGQINTLNNTKLQLEDARFKYEHDLLDIEHAIGTLKSNLARDKVLLDGNAMAPSTYKQEEEELAYELKLRDATAATRDRQERMRASQLRQLNETLSRLNESVASARASLEALTIRAPIDGQLTALDAEVGQAKEPGAVLGQVGDPDHFKLTAQVDEFYLGRVILKELALFTLDEHAYKARVAKIYPQVTEGTFKVDLDFTGTVPPGLQNGQAIDLKLELGGVSTALLLPNGPFYQDTGGRWVFVLSPDGRYAVRRNVRLGRRNPDYTEVLEGLTAGERVIISGYEAFQKIERIELQKGTSQP